MFFEAVQSLHILLGVFAACLLSVQFGWRKPFSDSLCVFYRFEQVAAQGTSLQGGQEELEEAGPGRNGVLPI